MYDSSGLASTLRGFCSINLGLWHIYKQASVLLWREYGRTVFAPLLHRLMCTAHYTRSPLAMVTRYMTFIRIAYPDFRDDYLDVITNENLRSDQLHIALDVLDLCELWIPVVAASSPAWSMLVSVILILWDAVVRLATSLHLLFWFHPTVTGRLLR